MMPPNPVQSVLLILDDCGNTAHLRHLYEAAGWHVRSAATVREAAVILEAASAGLLLCDYALRDGSWRDILTVARNHSPQSEVLVTSRIADEHMWAEVLHLGGFDLIVPPFEAEEVIRVSTCACPETPQRRTHVVFAQ